MMKKCFFPTLFGISLLIISGLLLTGCGSSSVHSSPMQEEESSETESPDSEEEASASDSPVPFSHAKPKDAPVNSDYVFPETAPFIDDTGKSMQRDGNCLYSYYNGRLIRFDKETEETDLLYQTASTHRISFCLYEDDIYFVERTGYDSLDDRDTSLWRIGKNGENLTLLQDDILNAGTMQDWTDYSIDIYNNIIYLMKYIYEYDNGIYVIKTANLYYRLENDGTVSEIDEAETLYGMLPHRFSPVSDSDFPYFPYAMRNYGYIFMQDSQNTLYRMEPVSGVRERITLNPDAVSRFAFSGDLIFMYSSYEEELSLYNLSDKTFVTADIPSSDYISYPAIFPSEQGFFLCSNLRKGNASSDVADSRFAILHIQPDGSLDMPFFDSGQSLGYDFYNTSLRENSCIDDNFFYCYQYDETQNSLMRFSFKEKKNPTFERLAFWSSYPTSSPAVVTTEEKSNNVEIGSRSSVSYSIKKLFLEEKTAADRQINQTLTEIYTDFETYVDEFITDEREQLEEDPDLYESFDYASGNDFSLYVYLDYMDDDTISFCCSYYQYYSYAAHGYYWSDYYVFDRETGERLSFEDFAGNSTGIINIARPYVEKAAGWDFDSEMLLEISRFSLSEDGYTLYFAPYDIDCYAAGSFLITIPFEAFEKEL